MLVFMPRDSALARVEFFHRRARYGIVRDMVSSRTLLLTICCSSLPALAGTIGFAQATGYYKKETRPTLYQPLNLLDARDATAWCTTTSDPLNDQLSVGFNGVTTIEQIRVSTGNSFDQHTWEQFARAKKIVIKAGKERRTLELEDKRGFQDLAIEPPLKAVRFTVEVLDQYPAEEPDSPACVTDLVFISEGRPLNGPYLTSKLKYDKSVAGLMGVWFAGYPGTPDQFLTFNFDGTFRYTFEPFDEMRDKPKMIEGTYDVTSTRLVLQIDGKRHVLKYSKENAKKGPSMMLSFEGELPVELKGPFRSVP